MTKNCEYRGSKGWDRLLLVFAYSILPCWFVYDVCKNTDFFRKRREKKRLKELATLPKVKKRKRALTLAHEGQGCMPALVGRKRVQGQNSCALTHLPVEIRRMIWAEYLGTEDDIYVIYALGKLCSLRRAPIKRENVLRKTVLKFDIGKSVRSQYDRPVDILPLLQTCRKM